jgi:hypothetical protein
VALVVEMHFLTEASPRSISLATSDGIESKVFQIWIFRLGKSEAGTFAVTGPQRQGTEATHTRHKVECESIASPRVDA